MNTYRGRIVYDRKLHAFTEGDVARILNAALKDLTWWGGSVFLSRFLRKLYEHLNKRPLAFAAFVQVTMLSWLEVFTKDQLMNMLEFVPSRSASRMSSTASDRPG